MMTYLEIQVSIRYEDPWFKELRSHFSYTPVRWQKGYYHITMAFITETPKGIDIRPILERHLSTAIAPTVVFDRLDAFSIKQGRHIVHLTTSDVPERRDEVSFPRKGVRLPHAREILLKQEEVILFDGNVEILLKTPVLGIEQTANGGGKNLSF